VRVGYAGDRTPAFVDRALGTDLESGRTRVVREREDPDGCRS
jgi:hypothetical protein